MCQDEIPTSKWGPEQAMKECLGAITIATAYFSATESVDLTGYKLTSVKNVSGGAEPNVWRLTLKRHSLLPGPGKSRLGAGGELFVQVDTRQGSVCSLTYGE